MFEEGDFEVVDECTGEDDPEIIENAEPPKTDNDGKTNGQTVVKVTKGILKMPSVNPVATPTKVDPPKGDNSNAIDFTVDVTMETDNQNEDDGVIQIDVTDSIILDGEDSEEKSEGLTKCDETDDTITAEVVETILPEHAWYEEKLNGKVAIVKERLSKLARVLEFSYPTYQPWLEHYKDPVCQLEPPRRCPLTRPHSNRWKFICSRKPVQESTNKEEDSAEGTVNKKVETVWRLGPTDGSGVNTDNASQYPPFVMRVVKVFEEFIQNVELTAEPEPVEEAKEDAAVPENINIAEPEVLQVKTEEAPKIITTEAKIAEESKIVDTVASEDKNEDDENNKDETSDEKDTVIDRNHNWLWLLVRSNSKDELMVFATGKKISQATMEKLKETFETGPGKDCNVKSLYCKSIAKLGNSTSTNITFLAGTEALDETVGGLKIQLAPKTNFWCNAAGVEQLGAAVGDLLNPVQKFTVAEIGCGLGLIGLMQAKKCRQVIGLDAPSEIEEAEMTSELNKITNSSFVMGQPNEMMAQITKLLKNTRSAAIVNANTKIGRTIEMMTALRKIPTLRRVVMITTLTKQSVRAILELTRPADGDLGNPFMPVRAVLVDTLPVGPHFEVVIRMERLTMHKMSEPWFWNHVQFRAGLTTQTPPQNAYPKKNEKGKPKDQSPKGTGNKQSNASPSANKRANNRANRRNKMKKQAQLRAAGQGVVVGSRIVVEPGLVTGVVKNPPKNLVKNPMATGAKGSPKNPGKNGQNNTGRGGARGKRPHSPDRNNAVTKKFARNNKTGTKPVPPVKPSPDSPTSQSDKVAKPNKPKIVSPLKRNPMARVQGRGSMNSGGQKRRRNWPGDVSMMRGGQPMSQKRMRDNNQTRGNDMRGRGGREPPMDPVLLRQVQEQQMLLSLAQQKLHNQGSVVDVDTAKQLHNMLNIVLEQTNKLQHQLPRSVWDRIAPPGNSGFNSPPQIERDNMGFRDRFVQDMGPQDIIITAQNNRQFMQPNQQQQQGPMPLFPVNRAQLEPNQVAPAGMSGLEFTRSQGMSERSHGSRDYRKAQNTLDNWHRQNPFGKQSSGSQQTNKLPSLSSQVNESSLRGSSPKRPLLSPPRLDVTTSRRFESSTFPQPPPLRRPNSPPRRQISPPRRQASPPRIQTTEIFHRRPAASQGGRQQQQQQLQTTSSTRRGISPPRQREQLPATRTNPPLKKLGDEWDISNKNTLEQGNYPSRQGQQQQQRSSDRNTQESRWSNDRPTNTQNWDQLSGSDRFRKNANQDKWENKDITFMGGSGDAWNAKQNAMKNISKEQWSQGGINKQWGSGSGVGGGGGSSGGDNWNARGKDNFVQQSNSRMDSWRDGKKVDKEDWSDLPEDARDPWADDGGSSNNKQRWQNSGGDRGGSSSNWGRDNSSGNWQNKGSSMSGNKSQQWPTMGNQNSNESRWMPQNDSSNKTMSSGNWQGNSNNAMNNWRSQNYSQGFSSQRSNIFGSNNFKDGR